MADNLIIMPNKGCVFMVRRKAGDGLYKLTPPLTGSDESPIIIDGPEITSKDNTFAVSTLDSRQFVYTFGKDFGNFVISGRILLGKGESVRKGLQPLLDWFEANRVANNPGASVALDIPGNSAVRLIVNSMVLGRPEPEFNIQVFAIRGVRVEPPSP